MRGEGRGLISSEICGLCGKGCGVCFVGSGESGVGNQVWEMRSGK